MRAIPFFTLWAWATGVMAGTGQIDSFTASETTVLAGAHVDFAAAFTIQTSFGSYGGENPSEPEPAEGSQTWLANWSVSESELLDRVSLDAAGKTFQAYPGAPAGGTYSGQWSFSLQFTQPGNYFVDLTGGWTSNTQQISTTTTGSRACWNSDPGGSEILVCSPWEWTIEEVPYDYVSGGSFDASRLEIRVLAVPEPAALSLASLGLAAIIAAVRRRGTDRG